MKLADSINNEVVLRVFLKVAVLAMRLNTPDKLPDKVIKAIKETKSTNLLPLRVIVTKIKEGRLDFAPSPKDLFHFIKGDEWVDWLDIYLNSSQKSNLEIMNE